MFLTMISVHFSPPLRLIIDLLYCDLDSQVTLSALSQVDIMSAWRSTRYVATVDAVQSATA